MRVRPDISSGQAVPEVWGFRFRVKRPHDRQSAGSDSRTHFTDHLIAFIAPAPDPGDAVWARDRKVGLQRDPVTRRLDDHHPRFRRLAVVIRKVDERLRYCGHAGILASPATMEPVPGRLSGGWVGMAGRACGVRLRRVCEATW